MLSGGGGGGSDRILRYGETINSLFCFLDNNNENNNNYHWKLCHDICLGSKGNDACSWVEALELSLNRGVGGDDISILEEKDVGAERILDAGEW